MSTTERPSNPPFSLTRLSALILRHWYLTIGSGPRALELIYWPTVQMVLWGFIQTYLAEKDSLFLMTVGTLIGAVMLWDILFRGQLGLSIAFFEEVWSRSLGHIMVSPLRTSEFVAAMMTTSLIKTLVSLVPTTVLAFLLFGFNIYDRLGWSLVAFFANLIVFGWALGLFVSGLVLRFGQGVESLAWALTFAIAPLCGIYYPVDVLPGLLQPLANILPASYVFEGMRMILIERSLDFSLLWKAALLNILAMAVAIWTFTRFLNGARVRGSLLQLGE
ncbi:MAG: ABC transporter permease [Pseudomonadota bacterium]